MLRRSVTQLSSHGARAAVDSADQPSSVWFALLHVRSITIKSFILNNLFIKESLNFMFLTWQQNKDYVHLNDICLAALFIGTPRLSGRGGGLADVHQDRFTCRLIYIQNFRRYCRKLERLWKASKLEVIGYISRNQLFHLTT